MTQRGYGTAYTPSDKPPNYAGTHNGRTTRPNLEHNDHFTTNQPTTLTTFGQISTPPPYPSPAAAITSRWQVMKEYATTRATTRHGHPDNPPRPPTKPPPTNPYRTASGPNPGTPASVPRPTPSPSPRPQGPKLTTAHHMSGPVRQTPAHRPTRPSTTHLPPPKIPPCRHPPHRTRPPNGSRPPASHAQPPAPHRAHRGPNSPQPTI